MTERKRGPRQLERGDQMARQYKRGATLREIAEKHGISKAAVSKALKRRGCSPSYDEWRRRVIAGQRAAASRRERKTKGKKV